MPVEQPQLRVSIAGLPVAGAVFLELDAVGYFAAARFRVGFALGRTPYANAAYFAATGMQAIIIEAALGGAGFATLFTGQIDNVQIDLHENAATLYGRDLAARLIDSEIAESFVNQTSSQIAVMLAGRHQLAANVTATKTVVGQFYEIDYARSALGVSSRATTEWNLLAELAKIENFDLSVTGTTLNFGPSLASPPVLVGPSSFTALTLEIAAALPKAATVKSWNSRHKMGVSQTQGSGLGTTIIRPNLTTSQAQNAAQAHLAALGWHGTVLRGTMPADTQLMPGMTLGLSGTDSGFDRTYTVASVARSLNANSGFAQIIHAYSAG